jgi:alpha-galactosidase
VPWELNQQWLDLVARSGTPLFVSAAPEALGAAQRTALRNAFALAAKPREVGEPVDWFDNAQPRVWRFADGPAEYDWLRGAAVQMGIGTGDNLEQF